MGDATVLQVVIFRDGSLVGSEVFVPGDYAVGSDPGCELVLADEAIGRCQAFLSFREGKVTLQNVAADAEMAVNGQAQKMAEVRALDDVALGPYLLKFRVVTQKAKAAVARQATPAPAPAPSPSRPLTPAPVPARPAAMQALSPARQPAVAPPPPVAPPPVAPSPALRHVPSPALHPPPAAAVATEKEIPIPAPVHVPAPATAPEGLGDRERTLPEVVVPPAAVRRPPVAARVPAGLRGELEEGREPEGPSLRVRVFWGKSMVGIFGFAFGREVVAGPAEHRDVPLYRLHLPHDRYPLARCEGGGWVARVPRSQRAYRFEQSGWKAAEGVPDGDAVKVKLEEGKLLRLGDAAYSVELRADRVKQAPAFGFRDFVRSGAMLPFALVGVLGVAAILGIAFMPKYDKENADFTPQQMLRAAKAVLKPPDKPKEKEKKKKEEKREAKKSQQEAPLDVPQTKAANVNRALKAVQKVVTAGPAVESLLKATSKLAGGPKGYGDKGMGYKLSPLIGKPPIAMAGMGFGPGMGGFGTATKGMGAIRGMGGGGGGGIGVFAAGGTGKGKVAGTVVSAPSSGFRHRGGGGMLARELIAKVINEHLGEVRGCYERALLKEAGLAGKLVLEWTIGLNGRVEEIKVKQATIKGGEVPNCIVGSLKGWVFPKPTGGKVIVSYPFLFNSVGF